MYVKQFFNPCTGFIENLKFDISPLTEKSWRKSRFYTNGNTIHHQFFYIDGHTLGTKYSRRRLKANFSHFAIHNLNQISHICYSSVVPSSNKSNMTIPEKYKIVSYYDLIKRNKIQAKDKFWTKHKFNGWTAWNNEDAKDVLPKKSLSIAAFNPGKKIVLGAGDREDSKNLKERVDLKDSQEIPIYLRQMKPHENKCVWFAACLCVHLQCPQDAKIMQMQMMGLKKDVIEKYADLVIFKRKSIISGGALSEILECKTKYNVASL